MAGRPKPLRDRVITIYIRDRRGHSVSDVRITFFVDGEQAGTAVPTDGRATIQVPKDDAQVAVSATYDGETQRVELAPGAESWTFTFPEVATATWDLLVAAAERVPGGVWVFGPVALGAAAAIVLGLFLGSVRLAFLGTLFTLTFVILFYAFAKGTQDIKELRGPLTMLVWAITLLFALVLVTFYFCVFFGRPLDLRRWIDASASSIQGQVHPSESVTSINSFDGDGSATETSAPAATVSDIPAAARKQPSTTTNPKPTTPALKCRYAGRLAVCQRATDRSHQSLPGPLGKKADETCRAYNANRPVVVAPDCDWRMDEGLATRVDPLDGHELWCHCTLADAGR
jgi:hypothetical protein